MSIYTRTGDTGTTGLFGGARVPKCNLRVAAYGEIDELNSVLGAARVSLREHASLEAVEQGLARIQGECFVIGALLATPSDKLEKLSAPFDTGLPTDSTKRLEGEIDVWEKKLPPLKTFILPGGGHAGSVLHLARAVSRRAERTVVDLSAHEPVAQGVIVYLNRLSTWLFVAARFVNQETGNGETPWNGLPKK